MEVIKFFLVILLCIPIACLLWFFFNNLIDSIKKQQNKSERIRKNKTIFQENSEKVSNRNTSKNEVSIMENIGKIRLIEEMSKLIRTGKKRVQFNFNIKNKRSKRGRKL